MARPLPMSRLATLPSADTDHNRHNACGDSYDENYRILLSALTDRPGQVENLPGLSI